MAIISGPAISASDATSSLTFPAGFNTANAFIRMWLKFTPNSENYHTPQFSRLSRRHDWQMAEQLVAAPHTLWHTFKQWFFIIECPRKEWNVATPWTNLTLAEIRVFLWGLMLVQSFSLDQYYSCNTTDPYTCRIIAWFKPQDWIHAPAQENTPPEAFSEIPLPQRLTWKMPRYVTIPLLLPWDICFFMHHISNSM